MHLVFISSLVPVAHPTSGYDIANRVIVDALRALGHQVSVLGFLQTGNEIAQRDETSLLGTLEVTNAKVGRAQKLRWLLAAFQHGVPVSVAKMHAASRSEVTTALDSFGPFDGLILNSVQLPSAFFDVFDQYPYCFVAHNVEADSAAENAQNAGSAIGRLLFRREAKLLRRLEAMLCNASTHVFTLADADQAALGLAGTNKATTLPLVTSMATPPAPVSRQPTFDLGMIGSWTWAANRAGLDWFLAHVVPLLPLDMEIAIAGGMGQRPDTIASNVSFLGRVPDARAFVRSVRVIPLVSRMGTGVQLKTIETFEMGLPAVATQNALRGLSSWPGNCVLADDPAAFADALVKMVGRARDGENLDLDGRAFHARQTTDLKTALEDGLENLKFMVNKG